MGHVDIGSSVSLPSNLNPNYLTAVELENMQLRSHLAKANKQIEEVLARLPPLAIDVNVEKRQSGSHKSRRNDRSKPSRSGRTATPSSAPMAHNHQNAQPNGPPRGHRQVSRSVRTLTPSSVPPLYVPGNAHGNPRGRFRASSQRQHVPANPPASRSDYQTQRVRNGGA